MARRLAVVAFTLLFVSAAAHAATNEAMLVSPDWLARNLKNVTILEIGDAFTYGSGHIPGARLVPFASLVTDRDGIPQELPPSPALERVFTAAGIGDRGRIVIYSRDPLYAARAFFTLDYLGHAARVALLDGGFTTWKAEGRPVATDVPAFTPRPFNANLNPGALTTRSALEKVVAMQDLLGDSLVIIDARPDTQFALTRIPGAVNVPVTANYDPASNARLKSESVLRDIYVRAGVNPRSTNITYCRTGMQASMTYFVLRYLGFDAVLYDGSMTEWGSKQGASAGR
jgi:thiosulfate/3-mercaptopyruvate sulfurtransferase